MRRRAARRRRRSREARPDRPRRSGSDGGARHRRRCRSGRPRSPPRAETVHPGQPDRVSNTRLAPRSSWAAHMAGRHDTFAAPGHTGSAGRAGPHSRRYGGRRGRGHGTNVAPPHRTSPHGGGPPRGGHPPSAAQRSRWQASFQVSMTGCSRSQPRIETVAVASANIPPEPGEPLEPAGSEHPQQMPVAEDQHVAVDRPDPGSAPAPGPPAAHIVGGLAARPRPGSRSTSREGPSRMSTVFRPSRSP